MSPSAENLFTLLDLEPRFDLDERQLQRAFLKASAENHPDRFTDPRQQDEAVHRAARINDAHHRLKDPAARASVLLDLLGANSTSSEKALPDGFLIEMLEVREGMAEAQADQDQARLDELEDWAQQQRDAHLRTIAELFNHVANAEASSDPTFANIRVELNALRYVERMLEQLDPDYTDQP